MNPQRVLFGLLVANLLATLLVYRDVAQLREQVERPRSAAVAAIAAAPTREASRTRAAPDGMDAPKVRREDMPSPEPQHDSTSGVAADAVPEDEDLLAIKARFEKQYVDADWTGQVQRAVQNAADGSVAYTEITRSLIECREQICRLALGYNDPAVFDAFIGDLTVALKGEPASSLYFAEPDTLGGYTTVDVYLVRE